MATTRSWRPLTQTDATHRPRLEEIAELNEVFSESFTDRYRRDGMTGVRVPHLNPVIWRSAIEDADAGAMLWRDDRGAVAAFNMAHRSGTEGWMGPLAVRNEYQGHGIGKEIVGRGIAWLKEQGATVIGLETMPRTMDNIGFYSRLGFVPGHLTVTVTLEAGRSDHEAQLLSRLGARDRVDMVDECRQLLHQVVPGLDYTREIVLTSELGLGDTLILSDRDRLVGYALTHTAPLVEGRVRDELRVLKLVLDDDRRFGAMVGVLTDHARKCGAKRVAFRMQGGYSAAYQHLIAMGAHVRWTDLRMSLGGYEEKRPEKGLVLSNWEI
jgi:GNAT superfamily N-acetyltransferase